MYAAAWAHTSREARAPRERAEQAAPVKGPQSPDRCPVTAGPGSRRRAGCPFAPWRPARALRRRSPSVGCDSEGLSMRLERKHAVLFLAIAAWNVFICATFTKNLTAAHAVGGGPAHRLLGGPLRADRRGPGDRRGARPLGS